MAVIKRFFNSQNVAEKTLSANRVSVSATTGNVTDSRIVWTKAMRPYMQIAVSDLGEIGRI